MERENQKKINYERRLRELEDRLNKLHLQNVILGLSLEQAEQRLTSIGDELVKKKHLSNTYPGDYEKIEIMKGMYIFGDMLK